MSNNWQEFENGKDWRGNTVLFGGDEIKLSPHCRNAGAIGRIVRLKRKNYAVIIDGKEWSIPPSLIDKYRRNDEPFKAPIKAKSKIKTSSERFYAECQGGDICLMHRGGSLFDVVEVIEFDKSRAKAVRCRVVGKNKIYRYDAAWFVQKLDGSRITTE